MISRLIRYLIYLVVLILPFFFFPGLVDPFELPKIVLFNFLVLFSLLLLGSGILTHEIVKVKFTELNYGLLLFLASLTIGSILGVNLSNSIWGQYYRYQGLITITSLVGFSFIVSWYKSIHLDLGKLYKYIGITGAVTSILVILQALFYYILNIPIYTFYGRMTAFLGNPNFTAGFLALSFIFFVYSFKKNKYVYWLIFLVAIILTFSRGGLLSFLIGSLFLFYKGKVFSKYLLIIPVVLVSVFMIFMARPQSNFDNRSVIWSKAIDAIVDRPLLGWGVENFDRAFAFQLDDYDFDLYRIRVDKAHNELLEILVSGGVISASIWLIITGYALFHLWKRREEEIYKINFIVLVVFLSLAMVNVLNINEYLFYYLVLGFSASKS